MTKTLSFRELKVGRSPSRVLLDVDSDRDGVVLGPGIHLLVAPNGFGKTSFLQTVAGALRALGGEARWESNPLKPEADALYISEYLSFPKFIYPGEWVEFLAGPHRDSAQVAREIAPWVERFGLSAKMNSYLGRMSQGERRKVTWLGAHASQRALVLLDEPLDGLDLYGIQAARAMLTEWKREGRVVCIVAHQVTEVLDLCAEVLLFGDGRMMQWSRQIGGHPAAQGSEAFREKVRAFYA